MTENPLDELIVPAPPYRSARPFATLVAQEPAPGKAVTSLGAKLEAAREKAEAERRLQETPERIAADVQEHAKDTAAGIYAMFEKALEGATPDLRTAAEGQLKALVDRVNAVPGRTGEALAALPPPPPVSEPAPPPPPLPKPPKVPKAPRAAAAPKPTAPAPVGGERAPLTGLDQERASAQAALQRAEAEGDTGMARVLRDRVAKYDKALRPQPAPRGAERADLDRIRRQAAAAVAPKGEPAPAAPPSGPEGHKAFQVPEPAANEYARVLSHIEEATKSGDTKAVEQWKVAKEQYERWIADKRREWEEANKKGTTPTAPEPGPQPQPQPVRKTAPAVPSVNRRLLADMGEAMGQGMGTGKGAGMKEKKKPEPVEVAPPAPAPQKKRTLTAEEFKAYQRQLQQERAGKEDVAFKREVTKSQTEALAEDAAKEEAKHEFEEWFEQKPQREAPRLDNLAAIQQFLEFSRRTGRSKEFIVGLEQLRKEYAEKAERPRPQPGRPESPEDMIRRLQRRIDDLERRATAGGGAGGGEQQPPEPPLGPEAQEGPPQPPGEAERAVREISEIQEMGETKEPGWWERRGLRNEASAHDVGAWLAGVFAKRAKDSLARRNKRIKELEREAKKMAERSATGAFFSPIQYGYRLYWHKWRRGLVEGAVERYDAGRAYYENTRNETLNRLAHRYDTALMTHEERTKQAARDSEEMDKLLDTLDGDLKRINLEIARERDADRRSRLLEQRDWFMADFDGTAQKKEAIERIWVEENAQAVRLQNIKNGILREANPSDRPETAPGPREILDTRQKRTPKKPLTQAA